MFDIILGVRGHHGLLKVITVEPYPS